MLAAKLARAAGRVHPKDWVEVYESHTVYEWTVQLALNSVEPWGDDRADMRAAFNTMAAIGSDDQGLLDALIGYLKVNERTETLGPEGMRRALEG